MTRDECRLYQLIPLLIIIVYILILYSSHRALEGLNPRPIPQVIPLALALLIPAAVTIKDTITLLGGPRRYFCGGAKALRSLRSLGDSCESPKDIVTYGPFAYTRHPVYSSTLLTTISLTLVYPGFLLAIPLVAVWVYVASILEERILAKSTIYLEYQKRVPRLSLFGVIRYGYSRILGKERAG